MADIVERHGGTVTEFAGDGLMALFGAPSEREPEDQVTGAIAAATEMQATLPVLNQRWFKIGLDHELQTRIGINTGVSSVGTFGSEGRGTYTAIGLQINIAARIQAECEPGSILLSQASWQLVKDTIACESRGETQVKGVHFPIKLYTPTLVRQERRHFGMTARCSLLQQRNQQALLLGSGWSMPVQGRPLRGTLEKFSCRHSGVL